MDNIRIHAVTLETLKSRQINDKAAEKGIALYKGGHVSFAEHEDFGYLAQVDDAGETRKVILSFTRDGCDLDSHICQCNPGRNGIICKHIVAAVLAVQGGIAETKIIIGKSASVQESVRENNVARAVGSGSLDVFATPMLVALMERAACEVLNGALDEGQTSVGTSVTVNHTAASPIGAKITATAEITSVRGRKIEFDVMASDDKGKIGDGKHTRVVVNAEEFLKRVKKRYGE